MQTNHLSHFLLTKELFPLLNLKAEAVGEARIVNHSSIAAWMDDEPLDGKYYGKNGGSLQQLIPISTWHAYAFTHAHTYSYHHAHKFPCTRQLGWGRREGNVYDQKPKMEALSAIKSAIYALMAIKYRAMHAHGYAHVERSWGLELSVFGQSSTDSLLVHSMPNHRLSPLLPVDSWPTWSSPRHWLTG